MATIRALKDTSILEAPKSKPRAPSPAALARQAEYRRLRAMIEKLADPAQVYEVVLEPGEKVLTVRQRLMKVAAESGKEIVVRTYGKGFAVGLLTPERVTRRGRRTSGRRSTGTQHSHPAPMAEAWTTGIVISATSADIVRWSPGATLRRHMDAVVPVGRRPARSLVLEQTAAEERRRAFFAQVSHTLSNEDDLLLLGDSAVVEAFASLVRANDATAGRLRRVDVRSSGPLSERQLIHRVRAFAGKPARGRTQDSTMDPSHSHRVSEVLTDGRGSRGRSG